MRKSNPLRLARLAVACSVILIGLKPGASAADNNVLHFGPANENGITVPQSETVVDDRSARFSVEGDWTAVTVPDSYGSGAYQTSEANATARWTPLLPDPGDYEVFVWWGEGSGDDVAEYTIQHADGSDIVVRNQGVQWGRWVSLGIFPFDADAEEFVQLRRMDPPNAVGGTLADAVVFVNRTRFDLTDALTVEAWVKLDPAPDKQRLVSKGKAWGLTRETNDTINFYTGNYDLFTAPLTPGAWYHLAAVFDGTRKAVYVDGVEVASTNHSVAIRPDASPLQFGAEGYRGFLDNVRVWSVARSAESIAANILRQLRGNEPGLLGDWPLDENLGSGSKFQMVDRSRYHHWIFGPASGLSVVSGTERAYAEPADGELGLHFNGYDQEVTVAHYDPLNLTNRSQMTLETWVYFDFLPKGTAALISKGANAWELRLSENGKITFRTAGLTDQSGALAEDLVSATALETRKWYYVAAVWDGANQAGNSKKIYIKTPLDPFPVLDRTQEGVFGQVGVTDLSMHVGSRPLPGGGSEAWFEGILDEVRLWRVARTSEQILDHHARRLVGIGPGLSGVWSLNEGSGGAAASSAGSPFEGVLAAGMTNLNHTLGVPLAEPLPAEFALHFDGEPDHVLIPGSDGWLADSGSVTLEAWIRPAIPFRENYMNIIRKGDRGFGLGVTQLGDGGPLHLMYFTTADFSDALLSERPLELDQDGNGSPIPTWNHVAVVVDGSANTTTFYINGLPAGTFSSAQINNPGGPFILGVEGIAGGQVIRANYFRGAMDEVRVWSGVRNPLEIELFAFSPLQAGGDDLAAYWGFNDGVGTTLSAAAFGNAWDGALMDMGDRNWIFGQDWGVSAPELDARLVANPAAAGLWMGQVVLDQVNEVQSVTPEKLTPHASGASFHILLHVDDGGQVKLLKDVMVLRKASDEPAPAPDPGGNSAGNDLEPVSTVVNSNLVLVTDPTLIPGLEGVVKRGGKMVAIRYGTVAYDFEGLELPVLGGVGTNLSCLGKIRLDKDLPTNPFRHKFHPDHRSGFDLSRQFSLEFDGEDGEAGYGVDRVTGVYRETILGLHKIALRVQGRVTLNRISRVARLNDVD